MIPIGGALPNSIASFNRAAEQVARAFAPQEATADLARGVGGVDTATGTGTRLADRNETATPESGRVQHAVAAPAGRNEQPDAAQAAAELIRSEQEVRANVAVTRAQDRTLGTLIDIFA